ncbi:hypothetical protein K505DRAFT_326638 [Melanomma pulvis-pyrius CBS 109.77]|uniref:Uncharacterized protein n=1 Tax=Melanomma pulvis-pyrius CBS 109.77 TaxID=1314802 RepID=A0A6A6X654_9PLEO|nr:hypothetical protein K505DRAFT_326638 [Melanomma pulvis-pyrius CBS 109.77]
MEWDRGPSAVEADAWSTSQPLVQQPARERCTSCSYWSAWQAQRNFNSRFLLRPLRFDAKRRLHGRGSEDIEPRYLWHKWYRGLVQCSLSSGAMGLCVDSKQLCLQAQGCTTPGSLDPAVGDLGVRARRCTEEAQLSRAARMHFLVPALVPDMSAA